MTIDFNHKTMKEAQASDAINLAVEGALYKKQSGPRDYVGASAVGADCERALQFEYAGAPREKAFGPNTLRKFDLGHMSEEISRAWLSDGGFHISQRSQKTGQLFRFSQLDGKFAGTPDGVIIAGPEIDGVGYPALWEHKGVGNKTFKEIVTKGLKKARPKYYAQVAIYQAYLDLTDNPAIFTVTNLDTAEQLHLTIPFDADEAQRMTDRAVRVINATEAGDLLPRPFADQTHFICRMCSFSERCWSLTS